VIGQIVRSVRFTGLIVKHLTRQRVLRRYRLRHATLIEFCRFLVTSSYLFCIPQLLARAVVKIKPWYEHRTTASRAHD
jgi:hypothetical protein